MNTSPSMGPGTRTPRLSALGFLGLTALMAGCGAEPECVEDWHGPACVEDESVVKVDLGEPGSLPETTVGPEDLLWSTETLPIVDEPIVSVRGAVASCASGVAAFAVLSASPNGVIAVARDSGLGIGWQGGEGEGPGEFSARVQDIWTSGPCQVAAYDAGGHRVTWISLEGGVDSVRALPTAELAMIQHRLVGDLMGGTHIGLGFRVPGAPDPPEGGDVRTWYRVGRYLPADPAWRWEEAFEVPGIVQFISPADPPPQLNLGPSPYRPDTQVWTDSTGIWLANGHWPLLRRFSPDGTLQETILVSLPRQPVTEEDRQAFIDWHARRASDDPEIIERRRALAQQFNFTETGPHFHEALPMDEGVWLRVSEDEPGGWGSRWLVLDPHTHTPQGIVSMPPSSRPLVASGEVLLARGRGPLGQVVLRAYRLRLPIE